MKKYKVKMGYRVEFETEIEVEAESHILAMDRAAEARSNNALPPFKDVFATKVAVLSVSEKVLSVSEQH